MDHLREIAIAMFSLIIAAAAYSAEVQAENFPNQILFHSVPKALEFDLRNSSSYRLPVEVQLFVPCSYETIRAPAWIDAKSSEHFSYMLIPKSPLRGMEYEATVMIKAGNEQITKNIYITFGSDSNDSIAVSLSSVFADGKIVVKGMAENRSVEDRAFELKGHGKIPGDWTVKNPAPFTVSSQSKKEFTFTITPASDYAGKAEFTFSAGGVESTASMDVNYSAKKAEGDGFIGFLVAGGNSLIGNYELIFDIILVLVVVILAVAFASRLVNRTRKSEERAPFEGYEGYYGSEKSPNGFRARNPMLQNLKKEIMQRPSK